MTTKDLKTFYNRTVEYCIAAFNKEPDRIEIYEDGALYARFINYCCGDRNEDVEEIPLKKLTSDLDEIVKKRKEREEQEKIKRQKQWEEQEMLRKLKERDEELKTLKRLKEKYES